MAMGARRAANAHLARLEAAAGLAGCALACAHQSAEEFHRALIRDYLNVRGRRQGVIFALALGILAGACIWF
jgi:hypothetical protein